ncbi:hypothetical protein EPD60_15370 [Flaviaesturariibacter flavus]|uniref:Uncharacterized protein n=1 Tax=Flaviaesturariibacter flavus TaxID=2502780 RepID=A0A4R1B3K6_9BACT|nr:hypothetical protein EPD60_15370 [Flaviaesturariibacter flavus]
MKIVLLTTSSIALPSLVKIREHGDLHALYTTDPLPQDAPDLQQFAAAHGIPFLAVSKARLEEELLTFTLLHPDHLVLCIGFSWKLPASLLPDANRVYNIHFSLLPRYAGPVPLFWQIRNGDRRGGITIHRMTGRFDAGPVAARQEIALMPGENYGLYSARLSLAAAALVLSLIEAGSSGQWPAETAQDLHHRSYQRRPAQNDLVIDWKQKADAVEALVNACNPIAGGARTYFRGLPLQVLEVSPADGRMKSPAGTIVHADAAQGLFVCCGDGGLLRINIARMPEGTFSGTKLVALGFGRGERFGEAQPAAQPRITTAIHSSL